MPDEINDRELAALDAIREAMEALRPDERGRALAWAVDRYGRDARWFIARDGVPALLPGRNPPADGKGADGG